MYNEYLGRKIIVYLSSDPSQIGVEGYVWNETKNIFYIKTNKGIKIIPKKNCVFKIYINDWKLIEGQKIVFRPEDRIKLIKKRC